ncbi:MAG: enoyl-CoA hydratase/isomerase family protein [Rhizobiaceae bacterium]|nr:enoyl-CoA hydratase/isomerase family protein [Rhizobiaceae bacterium]
MDFAEDFGGGGEIRFELRGRIGLVTLARPAALNAVTHSMVKALARALDAWAGDDAVSAVVVRAEGRAFSAGGDIVRIYEAGRAGRPPVDFFADEYRLNLQIANFPKPYVALVDGIVMGGGVGISFHGSHRVMTENAVFAMPEVGIGFFPDVGASYLLSRLKGSFGAYLGLTGTRIRRGDACWAGLATHCIDAAGLPAVLDGVAETGDVASVLKAASSPAPAETDEAALHSIQHHFAVDDVGALVAGLEQASAADELARTALAALRSRSPTSLHVTARMLSAGSMLSLDECLELEFRIVNRMLAGHDFYEGIRAAIIDKDGTPRWRPATIEAVDSSDIERYFEPLGGGGLWT